MKVAIITVSDKCSRGEREDQSGPEVARLIREKGWEVVSKMIIPDEKGEIERMLIDSMDNLGAELVLTVGGTGFALRDVTPEATKAVIEREAPGLCEMIRVESSKITKKAYLSRAVAGIRKKSIIINLPGSVKGARESLEVVLPILEHAVESLHGSVCECGGTT